MKIRILTAMLVAGFALPCLAAAKEKKEPTPVRPIGWLYLRDEPRDLSVSKEDLQKGTRSLLRGSLVPVFKTKVKDGATYGRVASLNMATGLVESGWVKIDLAELKPPDAYPPDDELVTKLGAPYLDDVVAKHTRMARFLMRGADGQEQLLCYVLTAQILMARLVAFTPHDGKFAPGATLELPMTELQFGVTSIEIRNLVGDGNDCIIAKEYFRELAATLGSKVVIRRIQEGAFHTVWEAPIKFKNLSQYNAKVNILEPPEKNIGTPGTVTTGEVTYKPSGNGQTPVWKGKVEFFVIEREKALDSVKIEKPCPWNGTGFTTLQ